MDYQTIVAGGLKWRLRGQPDPALRALLDDPERWLRAPTLLKQSPTAMVARVPGRDGGFWILKTFQSPKGVRVLKALRSSRATREFKTAAMLEKAGILTARSVAMGEKRSGLLSECGYLVTEGIPDAVTPRDFLGSEKSGLKRLRVVTAIGGTLAQLHNAGFAHSDLNPSNFLVQFHAAEIRVWLIDLEGIVRSSSRSLTRVARDLRRLNRRVQVSPFTRLRFLSVFCRACRPALPVRELATEILAGQREWEVRRFGKYRWKVRLQLVNAQARELMANPNVSVPSASNGEARAEVSAPDRTHPGFVMIRLSGNAARGVDDKTIGYTAPLLGKNDCSFVLKLR